MLKNNDIDNYTHTYIKIREHINNIKYCKEGINNKNIFNDIDSIYEYIFKINIQEYKSGGITRTVIIF